MEVLKRVEFTSRRALYEQYDQRVGALTAQACDEAVGILQLPHSKRWLGMALGGRGVLLRYNAFVGGVDAVVSPYLHLLAEGFKPLALTDGLNFGSPENKKVMGDFVGALEGLNTLCAELKVPIISGNVSFYNETSGDTYSCVTPTPVTGLVGIKESHKKKKRLEAGDVLLRLSCELPLMTTGLVGEIQNGCRNGWGGEICVAAISAFLERVKSVEKLVKRVCVVSKGGCPSHWLDCACVRAWGFY